MKEFHLKTPLHDEDIRPIEIGDLVYFSGEVFTGRSRLQKYAFDERRSLPFSTHDRNVMIHVGPIVTKEENHWRLNSMTTTSSIRFEKWGARTVKEWGLKAIIGKTTMRESTMLAMKENICIHATPVGVTSSLYLDRITVKDVHLLDELGSIEAAWILELNGVGPFLVDIDSQGRNYFNDLDKVIATNLKKAYQHLNVEEDFEYTKLY